MALKDDFDDDHVAHLLAEDAKKTSRNYASEGLSAFLPKRRGADSLKPNTRFLSHIVREADSHNAALKRKEEVEAERRLRALQNDEHDGGRSRKRRRTDESDKVKSKRMFGAILAAADSKASGKSKTIRYEHKERNHRRKELHRSERQEERSRSRSPRRKERRSRTCQGRLSRSSSSLSSSEGRRSKRRSEHERPASRDRDGKFRNETDQNGRNESDPRPNSPALIRGRGAYKQKSSVNDRFAEDYDPSQDVSLDSDHVSDTEDWDMALEAMRDRAKYKKNQVIRMREAGFTDDEISKWEKSLDALDNTEDNLSNVKWSRRGEVREWDIGKS